MRDSEQDQLGTLSNPLGARAPQGLGNADLFIGSISRPFLASLVGSVVEIGGSYTSILGSDHLLLWLGYRQLDSASPWREATGSEHPFLKVLGYVLMGLGILLRLRLSLVRLIDSCILHVVAAPN
jgi:hypothetical protein